MIKGIDVSIWNGNIDWNLVRADGLEFAMIRSSYGDGSSEFINNGVDEKFEYNYAEAGRVGIKRGVYHYCYATSISEAEEEAKFFLSRISGKVFEYPVILDIEDDKVQGHLSKSQLTKISKRFLEIIECNGYYVGIYSSRYWFDNFLDMKKLAMYDTWLAEWTSNPGYSGNYGIWQYTSVGNVSGIDGYVDMNISYEDYPDIMKSAGLNGFEKGESTEKIAQYDLICYSDHADRMSAEILANALHLPIFYSQHGLKKLCEYKRIIHVGVYNGNDSRVKKVVSGKNRFETNSLVLKEIYK